jgi:large subunit ribosomal protein L27
MATKKAGGSSNNGRDSAGRRLGIKIWPNHVAKAGNILVRRKFPSNPPPSSQPSSCLTLMHVLTCYAERGQKFRAGDNVGMGKDHTLFAKITGTVMFTKLQLASKKKLRNVVHVVQ